MQVVMNNIVAYVVTNRHLEARHLKHFWSPYVTHCVDHLLEDIGKLEWINIMVEDKRNVTKYTYNYPCALNLMRKHTDNKELMQSRVTCLQTLSSHCRVLYLHGHLLDACL